MKLFRESMLELVTVTSTNLPPDVRAAMGLALESEKPGTQSSQALNIIAENIDMATEDEGPICQDTGMPTFEIKTPVGANQIVMRREIEQAVFEATRRCKLRPFSVDSLTGKNTVTNLVPGKPIIHFEQRDRPE
ncbi:MAG: fumarate hydratase, partial [Acidobacteria bacterium]|nr:fumarate hydratase [Acidobacteriota bacterium]